MAGIAIEVTSANTVAAETATKIGDLTASKYGELVGIPPGGLLLGNASLKPDQMVSLEYSVGGPEKVILTAPIPKNFQLDVSSNWSPSNTMGDVKSSIEKYRNFRLAQINNMPTATPAQRAAKEKATKSLNRGANLSGYAVGATGVSNTTNKFATAQIWEGPTPIRGSLAFEFTAEQDPETDVIQPLKFLYKLAAPLNIASMLIPPGPSLAGSAFKMGTNIKIRVGNIVWFTNVVIDNVSGNMDTILSIKKHKLLHANVDVSFASFFAVDQSDIDEMFAVPAFDPTGTRRV